jgi:hypothetical protein
MRNSNISITAHKEQHFHSLVCLYEIVIILTQMYNNILSYHANIYLLKS